MVRWFAHLDWPIVAMRSWIRRTQGISSRWGGSGCSSRKMTAPPSILLLKQVSDRTEYLLSPKLNLEWDCIHIILDSEACVNC
jgi:hypothetical protein